MKPPAQPSLAQTEYQVTIRAHRNRFVLPIARRVYSRRDVTMPNVGFAATTALFLFAALMLSSKTSAASKPGDTTPASSPIVVPFMSTTPETSSEDAYVLCFKQDATRTDCSGDRDNLSPAEISAGPLKAGKKLLVVLDGDDCLQRDLYLQKQSITPTDANPVRGGSPPKSTGSVQILGFDGGTTARCYALYPDPLTSDTYTTVHIAKKDSNGADAKEVDINSKPFALPEIHTFYRFGVSTGVAVSSLQNKTFAYSAGSTATKFSTATTSDPRLVEPVLFLTYYPLHGGLDSEAHGRWNDLGFVAGLSEKNPTASFYVGISTEPIRNIALIIGVNATQVSVLDPSAYDAGPARCTRPQRRVRPTDTAGISQLPLAFRTSFSRSSSSEFVFTSRRAAYASSNRFCLKFTRTEYLSCVA